VWRGFFYHGVTPAYLAIAEFTTHNVALVVPEQGIDTSGANFGSAASDEHSLCCG
jgi:hypothetical protein